MIIHKESFKGGIAWRGPPTILYSVLIISVFVFFQLCSNFDEE